jgi:hypothetical protein
MQYLCPTVAEIIIACYSSVLSVGLKVIHIEVNVSDDKD